MFPSASWTSHRLLRSSPASTPANSFDGLSLLPLLEARADATGPFAGRVRFTETEYAPPLALTGDGKLSTSQLLEAAKIYRVDTATDRVEVKREQTATVLNIRQYAAIGDHLLLAALPNDKPKEPSHRFMVVDLHGGASRPLEGAPARRCPCGAQVPVARDARQVRVDAAPCRRQHCRRGPANSNAQRHKVTLGGHVTDAGIWKMRQRIPLNQADMLRPSTGTSLAYSCPGAWRQRFRFTFS